MRFKALSVPRALIGLLLMGAVGYMLGRAADDPPKRHHYRIVSKDYGPTEFDTDSRVVGFACMDYAIFTCYVLLEDR